MRSPQPDAGRVGVAPNAELHSISVEDEMGDDFLTALALNRLALLNGGAIKAINISDGRALTFFEQPDGNSHLPQYMDWSARRHDILYVTAWGNTPNPDLRTPADEYNSIVVAGSEIFPGGAITSYGESSQMPQAAAGHKCRNQADLSFCRLC